MSSEQDSKARATAVVDLLKSAFSGRVITPDKTSEYETQRDYPWYVQTCWAPAAAYIQPSSAQEVAEILAVIVKTGSKFAIRTGGHNPNSGFSSVDGAGIVIDLRQLNSLSLDKEKGALHVGAGSSWGDVYSYLEDNGLSAIGGRDTLVGLAGFLLGGGLPAFPNIHGTGADGVRGLEVVLADSSIITANVQDNKELYRALKGGGSNFGIVTKFDLAVHPLIKVQSTINLYNPSDYPNIIRATVKVQEAMEADPKIGLFTNFNAGFVAVGMLYADSPDEKPKVFDPFFDLTSLITAVAPTTNGTLLSLAKAMAHSTEPQKRKIGTVTTKVSYDLYLGVYEAWLDVTNKLSKNITLHFTVQPVSKAGAQAGEAQGGNTMGVEKVAQCYSNDAAASQAINTMTQRVEKLAREKDLYLDFLAMNFANSSQDVLRSYGAANVRKLQETAAKYDPNGVFQKLQNDGFLLRKTSKE
ncbi:uncharacterized protein F4822DRAFT_441357 [Hypoxylon trugodes]|uniref:uncharacterized protein n=1 Tax=Hypoxylon trugodes TaxID=326681 RepID=UPI00218F3CAE|nr:uncharacterized protein F4822DRAFT_441357 [Hypoxylon trugodes]KAI1392342.1 hypothetical protein F4822DRAFT_441357 [Hypoxylon trugodes]